nr:hypothetical protein [Tanacetum cinerariifolium]
MPPSINKNINDVYERIMARMKEQLDQFVDQFANRINYMMNPRRRGDRNGQRHKVEESENLFFEGGDSSLFVELKEWEGDGVADEDYEEPLVFDDDQYKEKIVKEESMSVYDTDIEDVIKEEEGFVRKGGFGGEEDSIEGVVVMANDLCSSINQTTLSVDFEEDINTKSHELLSFRKSIIIRVSQSSFKFLIRKICQESYLKDAPMDNKLRFKTIKVRGRVIIKKGNLMQGIQTWMLHVQGTSEANSKMSFFTLALGRAHTHEPTLSRIRALVDSVTDIVVNGSKAREREVSDAKENSSTEASVVITRLSYLIDSPSIIQSKKQRQWPLKKDDFYFKILSWTVKKPKGKKEEQKQRRCLPHRPLTIYRRKEEKEEKKEERTATITSLDELQLHPFVNEGIERPSKGSTAEFQD